jgi:two-component system KDP operon response regulator KdpE
MLEMARAEPGFSHSQTMILREVWGPVYEKETHNLGSYIAQIRRKLEPEPSRPRHFATEAGMGYRFEPASRSDGQV